MKKSKKKLALMISLGIMDICAIVFLFVMYGPYNKFRTYLVTTSMTTMSHKYIARTFYTEKMINSVLSKNYIKDFDESTDVSKITVNQLEDKETYDSIYEQQILEHKKGEDYKIIEFDGDGYHAYIVAIYDPSKVSLYTLPYFGEYGKTISDIGEEADAKVAMNASGFKDTGTAGGGGMPTGTVIKDGEIVYQGYQTGWPGGLIGFTNDNILMLTKASPADAIAMGMRDAIEFGPFLIVNGEAAKMEGNGGGGVHPRTAIAQRQDGIVLFVVIDGNGSSYNIYDRGGVSYAELIEILLRYKAYNAANLDGGASTSLAVEGKLYNEPCGIGGTGERNLPTAWILK